MKRYIKSATTNNILTEEERIRLFGEDPKGEVVIPDTYTSIGDEAFAGCDSLTSVKIPNSVTSIGYCAFYDCSSLTSVKIGSSVRSIGDFAFCDCKSLTSVTIPNSVISIGNWAFGHCNSLASVHFEGDIDLIAVKVYAFKGTPLYEKMKKYYLAHENSYDAASLIKLPKNISTIIESTMPSLDNVVFTYNIDEDSIYLHADLSDEFDYEYEDAELEEDAIYAIEDWADAIANSVDDEKLKECILRSIKSDWYSGMTFYGGGDRPFTYPGFEYPIHLEI